MDCLVLPLQEKLEDWKKTVFTLDKEHAKGNEKNFLTQCKNINLQYEF